MKITKVPKAEIKGLLADVQTEINARYNGNIQIETLRNIASPAVTYTVHRV